jgi:hypothetical protein
VTAPSLHRTSDSGPDDSRSSVQRFWDESYGLMMSFYVNNFVQADKQNDTLFCGVAKMSIFAGTYTEA